MISPYQKKIRGWRIANPDEPGAKKEKARKVADLADSMLLVNEKQDRRVGSEGFGTSGKKISAIRQIFIDNENVLAYIYCLACANRQSRRGMEQLGSSSGS